jgi:hypothetical protein
MHMIGGTQEDGLHTKRENLLSQTSVSTSGRTPPYCAAAGRPGKDKQAAITIFVRNVWYAPT